MAREKNTSKKAAYSSPKGMHDILGEKYFDYQGIFEKASEIALYYGFKPIETPILEKIDVFTKTQGEGTDLIDKEMYTLRTKGGDKLALRPEGTAPIMRAYIEHGMQTRPQPVMLYHYGPFFRHESPQYGRLRELRQFGLEMLGTQKSIADAIVIKTMVVILEEAGLKDIVVQINSIGDKECRSGFIKELTSYYKKHLDELCSHCRHRIKTNPMRLLDCKDKKCEPFKSEAPTPVGHLCGECRKHFKEVLEYLEALEMPYEINNHLVRGLDYYTKTVFEIFDMQGTSGEPANEDNTVSDEKNSTNKTDDKEVRDPIAIASGGRYDYLAKALGSRKDVPSVGGGIGIDRIIMLEHHKRIHPRVVKKPKVYFIQLGFEAKLKSLAVIDILRKARLPIAQSLSKDGLGVQLGQAEKLEIPYTMIFGQKEAMEDSVIIRDMKTRSQETVKIENLSDHLKKLK